MKSYVVTMLLSAIMSTGFTQFNHGFIKGGYGIGQSKVSNALFDYSIDNTTDPEEVNWDNTVDLTLPTRQIPISMEVLTEGFYFDMGFSIRKDRNAVEDTGYVGKDGQAFWTRMAFGGYIGDHLGILIGGQYTWNELRATYSAVNSSVSVDAITSTSGGQDGRYYQNYTGGHQRGLSAHMVFAPNAAIALRASFMYDWLIKRGIPGNRDFQSYLYKGTALTPEASLYIMFAEDVDFGINITAGYSIRNLKQGYEDIDDPNRLPLVPETTISGYYVNFTLCIPPIIFQSPSVTTYTIEVVD